MTTKRLREIQCWLFGHKPEVKQVWDIIPGLVRDELLECSRCKEKHLITYDYGYVPCGWFGPGWTYNRVRKVW